MTNEATANTILAKTAKGAGWIIGWRMVTRILGLVSTLFLVRLLLPADFGLVALATGFGQAADSLSSLGVEEAVIREKSPSRELYDTAFTINVVRGLVTAAVIAAAAWPVAGFFNDQRLLPVMLVLAAGALASGFENIGIVDFRRDIAFEKEFMLMSAPRAASIVVVIALAFLLRSYWALIAGIITAITLRLAMSYVMHPFRPRFGLLAWRKIAVFSFWSWLLSLSSLARDRCDAFVIGRVLTVAEVGIFAVGAEIAALPTTEFVSPLGRACFSSFAAARNSGDEGALAAAFLRVLGSTMLIAVPAGIGISLVANPIVRLAFGANWLGAIPVIQILGVALSTTVAGMIAVALLNAYAVLQTMFWVQLGSVAVRIPLTILLVSSIGLPGGAIGAGLAMAVEHLLYLGMALRRLRLGARDLLRHTWRCLLATALMVGFLALLRLGWRSDADETWALIAGLAVSIATGAAIYGGTLAGLWLAAGRPAGAETDMIEMLGRMARRGAGIIARQRHSLAGEPGAQ